MTDQFPPSGDPAASGPLPAQAPAAPSGPPPAEPPGPPPAAPVPAGGWSPPPGQCWAPPPGTGQPGWGSGTAWAPPKPTGPAPGVTFASHGGRFVAYLIDAILLGVVTGAVFMLLFLLMAASITAQSRGGFFAIFALMPIMVLGINGLQFGYFAYLWYRGGQSLGMRAMNIRVVRAADGGPLTKQQAILRSFGYWVSGAVMYLGFIWILIDDRHQGWHDKIAETLVIDAR